MRALNWKLLRDLWGLKTQLVAIGLVIGCGVAMIVLAWSMLASLQLTQQTYYEKYRFPHVFVHAKRAPEFVAKGIERIPGVGQFQTRIVKDVTLDISGMDEPAVARLVSLPGTPQTGLNLVHLREGRLPAPQGDNEVLVSEGFAQAHGLHPGSHAFAIINGRRQRLSIVGVGLSPEYIYQIRSGEVIPNDRTFAVFWMGRGELAAAFNMEGAFNDVVVYLTPGAREAEVIERIDRLLDQYGGLGAIGRDMQISHRYVTNELRELRNMGYFAPVIFLVVAAFLLNVVLSRIIGTQREQIAALKAFGYGRLEIGMHYVKLTAVVVAVGVLLGIGAGVYLGRAMTLMYTDYFRFPVLVFQLQPSVVAWAVVISMTAALLGILMAVRRAMRLPPAAAMQPEPPSTYRTAVLERLGFGPLLSPTTRMIFRHLERRPFTTLSSIVGLSLAIAVIVLGNHAADSVDAMLDFQFFEVQHYNVSVGFSDPQARRSVRELERMPGVVQTEPMRGVAARIGAGHRTRYQEIIGLPADPQLFRLIDKFGRKHVVPPHGLLLSTKLAESLQVRLGDEVEVAILEGQRATARLPVEALIDDVIGTPAYARLETLHGLLREGDTISGAYVLADSGRLPELFRRLKETPNVATVSARRVVLQSFRDTLVRTILRMRAINLIFATIIASGVVYNSARITVAERSRDLATLRVLGYTRAEISYVLLGELAILTIVAIPCGMVCGYGLVVLTAHGYETELFRIPIVVYRSTYGLAVLAVLIAALVSGLIVRRRLDRLDLVGVLKARE